MHLSGAFDVFPPIHSVDPKPDISKWGTGGWKHAVVNTAAKWKVYFCFCLPSLYFQQCHNCQIICRRFYFHDHANMKASGMEQEINK